MKKILPLIVSWFFLGCTGNKSAEIKETDLDNTDNDDTSAKPMKVLDSATKDSNTALTTIYNLNH